MGERNRVLSERLQMLARMVTPGSRAADVGCDHAFLSIYLVREGISPAVIATDVRKGPLAAAKEHIEAENLSGYIETRLSDGLKGLLPGEVDTVICAGMGGRLMQTILSESMEKVSALKELILQPQSELKEFRRFLRGAGLKVTEEDAVREDGKYYFAMRAVPIAAGEAKEPADTEAFGDGTAASDLIGLCDRFGGKLLLKKNPVLKEYLRHQEQVLERLREELQAQGTEGAILRLGEVRAELDDVRRALKMF